MSYLQKNRNVAIVILSAVIVFGVMFFSAQEQSILNTEMVIIRDPTLGTIFPAGVEVSITVIYNPTFGQEQIPAAISYRIEALNSTNAVVLAEQTGLNINTPFTKTAITTFVYSGNYTIWAFMVVRDLASNAETEYFNTMSLTVTGDIETNIILETTTEEATSLIFGEEPVSTPGFEIVVGILGLMGIIMIKEARRDG